MTDQNLNLICDTLRSLLDNSVSSNLTDGILLSGGLDTTVLAYLASRYKEIHGFTVAFDEAEAPDVEYSRKIAQILKINHDLYFFNRKALFSAIREVVRIMKSYDPMEIRNSASIFIALTRVRARSIPSVMTGDGCDELFAGYSFFFNMNKSELDSSLEKMWRVMRFSSSTIGTELGIAVKLPYLSDEFKNYAMKVDSRYKVRTEQGKTCGKWIIRKAFEGILPNEFVWRTKVPIEIGTGTTILPKFFGDYVPDQVFQEKRKKYLLEDSITIRDKEHLFYYESFRDQIGVPYPHDQNARSCPQCHSNVAEETNFCLTCGAYPI